MFYCEEYKNDDYVVKISLSNNEEDLMKKLYEDLYNYKQKGKLHFISLDVGRFTKNVLTKFMKYNIKSSLLPKNRWDFTDLTLHFGQYMKWKELFNYFGFNTYEQHEYTFEELSKDSTTKELVKIRKFFKYQASKAFNMMKMADMYMEEIDNVIVDKRAFVSLDCEPIREKVKGYLDNNQGLVNSSISFENLEDNLRGNPLYNKVYSYFICYPNIKKHGGGN